MGWKREREIGKGDRIEKKSEEWLENMKKQRIKRVKVMEEE